MEKLKHYQLRNIPIRQLNNTRLHALTEKQIKDAINQNKVPVTLQPLLIRELVWRSI